jgi:hypothetical protein
VGLSVCDIMINEDKMLPLLQETEDVTSVVY